MKISQLVATKKYIQYYESVANKLPRGIKTQQQLLNLGYRVAVEDLGLAKAKTLDENFAAKLVNSYHKQCIDEGIGSFLGKAAGNVVGAVNAAGRGIKNAWNDAKAGYAAGKGSWDDKAAATPAAGGTAAAPAASTQGRSDGAAPAAVEPAAAPAGGGADRPYVAPAGGGIGDIMKAIDGLDPASKKQLAGELEKSINTPPPAEEEPATTPDELDAIKKNAGLPPAPDKPEAPPAPEAPPPAPEAPPAAPPPAPKAGATKAGAFGQMAAQLGGQKPNTMANAPVSKTNVAKPVAAAAPVAASSVTHTGGRKKGAGPSQTPNAIRKREARKPAAAGMGENAGANESRDIKFRSNFLGMDI